MRFGCVIILLEISIVDRLHVILYMWDNWSIIRTNWQTDPLGQRRVFFG